MTTLEAIIIASFSISLVSLVGVLLLLSKRLWTTPITNILVSFAAGTMLAVSFLELLPEAAEEAADLEMVFVTTFLGIVSFFILERFVLWFHHHDSMHGAKPATYLILIGDSVHNFIDGVAIAASFLVNPSVGIATTIAIAAHEIPQEVADFGVLVHGGMSKNKALTFNFITALTALGGAVVSYFFLANIENVLPLLLAFTAGMFIYIACSDLIPELHKDVKNQHRWTQLLPFLGGVVIMWTLVNSLHGHS